MFTCASKVPNLTIIKLEVNYASKLVKQQVVITYYLLFKWGKLASMLKSQIIVGGDCLNLRIFFSIKKNAFVIHEFVTKSRLLRQRYFLFFSFFKLKE